MQTKQKGEIIVKLRRLFASLLALVLVIEASPFYAFHAKAEENPQTHNIISAPDTNYILRSAAVKYSEGSGFLERGDTTGLYADDPRIDTLLTQAPGEFNKAGEEWVWMAYKVSAPEERTYTLGVTTNSCKWANFKIPMVVNHQVHTLTFTAKAQTQTVDVTLPAGEHVVTIFWPMPANESEVYVDADWNSYLWCNIASVTVDQALTASKPTAQEVEAAVASYRTVTATDANKVLWSAAVGDNGNGYLEFNSRDAVKADLPYIESLRDDAIGEFNKTGEEWGWFAYKVTAPADGTYTLTLQMQNCRNAPYHVPLYVNNEVYTLSYSATGRQSATVEVILPVGEHVVVMFMPMPVNATGITGELWVDYPWCNPESMRVDAQLTVSKPSAAEVEACFAPVAQEDIVIPAPDTNYILRSAAVKYTEGSGFLERGDTTGLYADDPRIDTLLTQAPGEFNKAGEEWVWMAYKVSAPEEKTYTLGVTTNSCKWANFKIPMVVNGEVYTLTYTAKAQTVTAEVNLPAGEHVVTIFWPMPANESEVYVDADWNSYLWCNIASVTVDYELTVAKPTEQEVEACFPDPVADSPLKEQSVLFVGDSITYSRHSWASKIGTQYHMDWTNGGVNGATISNVKNRIIRYQFIANGNKNYDYVIMHGGINDAMSEIPIGTVSDSFNVADFDKNTYLGGLETLFYYAYEKFPGAKLGYILNYATPNSKFGGKTANEDTKEYYEAAKEVCDKWGVPYIDLYSGKTADGKSYSYDILQVDKNAANFINNDAQEIHLSDAGYALISPYIAQWMETLTENSSPIPAANSGKYMNAIDEDKVLFGGFTAKSEYQDGVAVVGLQDRVYTGMAADQATIEMLPSAKDMLGNWAFASIAVEAAQEGEYTVQVEMSAKVPYQMGMLVDGEAYTLQYVKTEGAYQFIEQVVSLTEGTHYITFTAAMPNNDNQLEGDAWNLYPWTNIVSIIVDEGLQVLDKPSLEDVTAKLKVYTPAYTRVEAENAEYVLYNNYNTPNESNAAASGGMVVGGAWNSTYQQTFEELKTWLNSKGNAYVEYAIIAPADGEYNIRVGFLAGSNDKTIAKPYIAVIVNNTTYQAQFTKNWNQIDKVGLTVNLKEGLNIVRCTSMTTEQDIYKVRGWINHDFLDLDTRLTPVKRSSPVKVEAETSKYYNRIKVQDGAESENASGKVLGSTDRRYMNALKLSLNKITSSNLRQVPYFSITVTAPQDGYYPINVAMAGDGRLAKSTIGLMLDGKMRTITYVRTDKTTKGAMVMTLVYLTKGDHVLTFTTPMPATANPKANYSYFWANYDYVLLYDGLSLAKKQKAPTSEAEYVRIEVEEHAMFNMNKNIETAAGGAYYKSAQSVAEILENGIDGSRTPYIELTVQAKKAGTYTLYIGASAGMTAGNTVEEADVQLALEVNDVVSIQQVHATKSTNYTIIPLRVELEEGDNTLRLSHLTRDAHHGGTTWIDFDFIEMPAWVTGELTFIMSGDILEAESSRYEGFGESLSSAYSGGRYLGRANYDTVQEVGVTYDNMDPANLNGIPYVTYRVFAEKAGTYAVSVGFAAGLTNYTTEETQKGVSASFVVIVNGQSKQRVSFTLTSPSANMTRLVMLELQEGQNEVTVTGTTSEYVIDRVPRKEATYRLVWIDQDCLILSGKLSNLGQDVDPFDIEDSSYDFGQLVPRDPSQTPVSEKSEGNTLGTAMILWILAGISVVATGIVAFFIGKKRKNNKNN